MDKEELLNKIINYNYTNFGNEFGNCLVDMKNENQELKDKIDKALDKMQLLIDIGFDYDGLNQVDSLKGLIDELVDYAIKSKTILKGGKE